MLFEVEERFLQFSDCNAKTGDAIANLIIELLAMHEIALEHCRAQGYDNGSNMLGKYNGLRPKF